MRSHVEKHIGWIQHFSCPKYLVSDFKTEKL